MSDADTIERDIVPKTTQRQIHMPSYGLHTHTHTYTYSEPLKAMEQRVIIMRVNSRTPLSSSAGWCWELRPTGPAGNGNPHTASCHSFKPPYHTLSLQRVGIIPYTETWRHMCAFGSVCLLEVKKYSTGEHLKTWTHTQAWDSCRCDFFSVDFYSFSLNHSKEIKIIMESNEEGAPQGLIHYFLLKDSPNSRSTYYLFL